MARLEEDSLPAPGSGQATAPFPGVLIIEEEQSPAAPGNRLWGWLTFALCSLLALLLGQGLTAALALVVHPALSLLIVVDLLTTAACWLTAWNAWLLYRRGRSARLPGPT